MCRILCTITEKQYILVYSQEDGFRVACYAGGDLEEFKTFLLDFVSSIEGTVEILSHEKWLAAFVEEALEKREKNND